jgi:hypothetical protein
MALPMTFGALHAADVSPFERKAQLSREIGATVVNITDDLPAALWQYDTKDDPYPGWYVYRPGLLKIFPPKEVKPFVDAAYADKVAGILEQRCAILRKYGLKANFNSTEPQTMPESFFTAYPDLRGPRVDQPNRARAARWAPSVDEPMTLRLYAEAVKSLVHRCPEVESFTFLTSDSGSGFDWAPALYAGINGNAKWKDRPMEDRVVGFMTTLQNAAKEEGRDITIAINPIAPRSWMTATFSKPVLDAIVAKLPRGLAVSGHEGPDGRPFKGRPGPGAFGGNRGPFAPVVGISVPDLTSHPLDLVDLGDASVMEFNARLMLFLKQHPEDKSLAIHLQVLRAFAAEEVGEANADTVVEAWRSLGNVNQRLDVLNFGAMLQFGHVLGRWIDRPMVPFPEELTDAEKKDWRPFLFQAKGEDQALDLVDIQAMRMYEGWGAKLLFQRAIETAAPQVLTASQRIAKLAPSITDPAKRAYWQAYAVRLEVAYCLLESAEHMVSYQAHLDRVRAQHLMPEADPPLGAGSDWARTDMMELARKEIDTMIRLKRLIETSPVPVIETAASPAEETAMRLGPDLARKIGHKIETMNRHWRDYDRIFTMPNQ